MRNVISTTTFYQVLPYFLLRSYRDYDSSVSLHTTSLLLLPVLSYYLLVVPLPYMLAIMTLYQVSVITDTTKSSLYFVRVILPWILFYLVDDIIHLTLTSSLTSSFKYFAHLDTYKVFGDTKMTTLLLTFPVVLKSPVLGNFSYYCTIT